MKEFDLLLVKADVVKTTTLHKCQVHINNTLIEPRHHYDHQLSLSQPVEDHRLIRDMLHTLGFPK